MNANPYTNPSTKRGATFDTYFIVDGRSTSLRSLHERDLLETGERLVSQGTAPFIYTVTIYEAKFKDRNRTLLITPETYEAMNTGSDSDSGSSNILDEDELRLVQASATPDKVNKKETFWHGVDTGLVDPITVYDLETTEEEGI